MSTRLTLENNAGSSIETVVGGSYTHASTSSPCTLSTSSLSTALQSIAVAGDSVDHLVAGDTRHSRLISGPMAAGVAFVTSDTVKYTVQCFESHNNNNLFA